jgi:hypothetical protein
MNTALPATALPCEPVDYDPFAGGRWHSSYRRRKPQREIWLADQLGMEASLAFNLSVSLLLRGQLDVQALRGSLQDLVDRHEALRANVGPDGETFCVLERFEIPCRCQILPTSMKPRAKWPSRTPEATVETPFALGTQPLFRAQLLRLAQDEHLLVLSAHHIVCDGWSWWVVVRELGALYGATQRLPSPNR